MLDIYYVPPSTLLVPEDPGKLEFAGSVDLDAHRSLAALFERGRQAGADFQYFQDSMLKPAQVATLLQTFMAHAPELDGKRQSLAAFDALRNLLEEAVSRGMGLIAFSD
jgi:hypothetical protein